MQDSLAQRLARIGGKQTLRLTHIGRKSGKLHHVTIWFTIDGEKVLLATANVDRHWVHNVRKTPQVKLAVGGEVFKGTARFIDNRDEHEQIMARMRQKYWLSRLPTPLGGKVLMRWDGSPTTADPLRSRFRLLNGYGQRVVVGCDQ